MKTSRSLDKKIKNLVFRHRGKIVVTVAFIRKRIRKAIDAEVATNGSGRHELEECKRKGRVGKGDVRDRSLFLLSRPEGATTVWRTYQPRKRRKEDKVRSREAPPCTKC